MRYGSVCSGIEAATVAWHPLGWIPAFFSEIEKFPRQELKNLYPEVPLHGDFTTIEKGMYEPIELLVGGTPCQSFSLAGLRKGLDDPRGNLMLEFGAIARRLGPKWLVWENVPGVLSANGGRDFGTFLGMLAELGYGFAYRVLDAQYFGVPQRRRRVFVVGCIGDWRSAAAVLFERYSMSGNIAPSREEGKEIAPTIRAGSPNGGKGHGARSGDSKDELIIPVASTGEISHYLNAGGMGRQDYETETLVSYAKPMAFHHQASATKSMNPSELCPTLDKSKSPAIATFKGGQGSKAGGIAYSETTAPTLTAGQSGSNQAPALLQKMLVRRLTPRECERLQGFPDDYTKINEKTADGPRYKAIGNSMAVPVMRWIGQRLDMVEQITSEMEIAA
jgi:DNA (cytosine-5)-methyltransferase 1